MCQALREKGGGCKRTSPQLLGVVLREEEQLLELAGGVDLFGFWWRTSGGVKLLALGEASLGRTLSINGRCDALAHISSKFRGNEWLCSCGGAAAATL